MRGQRISLRTGLPYGWWKTSSFWAVTVSTLSLIGMMVLGMIILTNYFRIA